MWILWLGIGLVVGANIGAMAMCFFQCSKEKDETQEN